MLLLNRCIRYVLAIVGTELLVSFGCSAVPR